MGAGDGGGWEKGGGGMKGLDLRVEVRRIRRFKIDHKPYSIW